MSLKDFMSNDNFSVSTGVELLDVRDGYAAACMKIMPQHLNSSGICHGGAIFTLADSAFAAAVNSHEKLTLSISSNINFFKAISSGILYAEAKEIFNHKKLSNCEVRITDESGDLVAVFNGTGYRKEEAMPSVSSM